MTTILMTRTGASARLLAGAGSPFQGRTLSADRGRAQLQGRAAPVGTALGNLDPIPRGTP